MSPLLILFIIVLVLILLSYVKRMPMVSNKNLIWQLSIALGVVLLLVGLVTGRLNPLIALVVAAIPFLNKLLNAKNVYDNVKRSGQGQSRQSEVKTRYLHMRLDHKNGRVDGLVISGKYEGKQLSELSFEEIIALYESYKALDPQSAALVESFLNIHHSQQWQQQNAENGGQSSNQSYYTHRSMSREEAYNILGLQNGASKSEIITAHRKLMQKFHPDRGGSDYLASKINEAKKTLLA